MNYFLLVRKRSDNRRQIVVPFIPVLYDQQTKICREKSNYSILSDRFECASMIIKSDHSWKWSHQDSLNSGSKNLLHIHWA